AGEATGTGVHGSSFVGMAVRTRRGIPAEVGRERSARASPGVLCCYRFGEGVRSARFVLLKLTVGSLVIQAQPDAVLALRLRRPEGHARRIALAAPHVAPGGRAGIHAPVPGPLT